MRFCLLALLLIIGCSKTEQPLQSGSSLEGTWKTDCRHDAAGYYRAVVRFTGKEFQTSNESYPPSGCGGVPTVEKDTAGTFEIKGADTRAGATEGVQFIEYVFGPDHTFDIFVLRGNELQFGAESSHAEWSRPTTLSPLIYTKDGV